MHHYLRFYLFVLCIIPVLSQAQPRPLYSVDQQQKLQNTKQDIENHYKTLNLRLQNLARQNNWPLRQSFADGTVIILSGVSETGEPLYDITTTNRGAALTTRTDALYEGGGLGLNLTGGSDAMKDRLGVWDGGKVRDTHTELVNRVRQVDNATTIDAHATHVSGTMIATGVNPRARGMAPAATLLAHDFGNDAAEMVTAAPNLLVSNHSYEALSGWRLNTARSGTSNNLKWEWYGDSTLNDQKDYKFGFYDARAREWDRIANTAPYYLIVKAAGNARGSSGPPAGTPYFLGGSSRTSTTARAPQNGFDLIATYGTAKNILTVGAISVLNNGYNQISDPQISSFSSWGPTDDGRIKPDIVGVGVSVFSTTSTSNNAYATLSGTSMASPNVSGSVFLLQELYNNLNKTFLRSSTLKGLVLHTADDAGALGPDYQYGWGLLNERKAAEVILNRDQSHLLSERTLATNEIYTIQVVASGRGPLIATICWTDPEAPATTATIANVDNRSPKLINDLDLRISDGTTENLPWILDPNQPANLATKGDNIRDNVEQVLIPNPVPGRTYTITIKHKGTLTNGTQPYALVVSGIGGKNYCESRALSNADSKITKVTLGSLSQMANEGCQSYSDFMNQAISVSAGQSLPLEVSIGSCGADLTKVVKAFVDWNQDGDFDDANELIATSTPMNSGVFSTTLKAPSGLVVGNYTRLRIVCLESSDPNTLSACGTYPKGETQEFLLQFTRPLRDISLTTLVNPSDNFCGSQLSSITLKVRNTGLQTVQNTPLEVTVVEPSGEIAGKATGTLSRSLSAFEEATISLSAPFLSTLKEGVRYQFVNRITLPDDQDTLNNILRESRTLSATPTVSKATATYCNTDPLALISKDEGTAFWYNSPNGSTPFAVGNLTSSSAPLPTGNVYVALNDFSGTLGPATKSAFSGGSYSGNFGPSPLLKTEVPLLLESARLYTSAAGKITFTVLSLDDKFISSSTVDVVASRNPDAPNQGAPSGQVADDPNDQGRVYPLNLSIPTAGSYKITIEYEGGATIYRSNVGVSGFPFSIPGIIALKGALFAQNNIVDTLTNAYYYFYDLKIKSLGCPSPRVAITPQTTTNTTPTISFEGNSNICEGSSLNLRTSSNSGVYQWFLNNQAIQGATNATLTATTPGSYTVSTSVNNCLPSLSSPVALTIRRPEKPTISANGIVLTSNATSNIQWLLEGVPIAGANTPTFTAIQTGNYSVKASVNGCGELVSDEIRIVITSLNQASTLLDKTLKIYPNPASSFVVCEYATLTKTGTKIKASLYDLQGKLIVQQSMEKFENFFHTQFNLSSLQSGTFFAIIEEEGTSTRTIGTIIKP
ncbi:S8 family serine peptidase [Runella zeae]|uniref:S8 family serine peptidase n=1 Tax=Runella zeae TaxID=94255 RepID=UPI002357A317|nr:S8 family serine peptidase [Runella zeae]